MNGTRQGKYAHFLNFSQKKVIFHWINGHCYFLSFFSPSNFCCFLLSVQCSIWYFFISSFHSLPHAHIYIIHTKLSQFFYFVRWIPLIAKRFSSSIQRFGCVEYKQLIPVSHRMRKIYSQSNGRKEIIIIIHWMKGNSHRNIVYVY